jgi:murein L,D-transpeptidase YcbB/YkuD
MRSRPAFPLLLLLAALAAGPGRAQGLGPAPLPADGFAPLPAAPRPKARPQPAVHERVVARGDRRPTLHGDSLAAITAAAGRYRAIAEAGGWPILPEDTILRPGSEGEAVRMLRRRLAAEGDLPEAETEAPLFDAALLEAVKRFQARHGQSRNGLVSGPTLAALRVSAEARHRALAGSARRLAAKGPVPGAERYVVVNIPSASVEAVERGAVTKRLVAVVGKKDRPSPEVETRITNVNLNPTWTVPASIIRKDIIPRMKKDPGYLAKARIRIFGASGAEIDPKRIDWGTERATAFTLRQESGAGNALGQLRIDMPNREAVYMHDTPSKRLFARDDRFHSSGCVRVENVRDLAVWILEGQQGWDRAAIDAAIASGARRDIRPAAAIPVIWTYLTGYVTPDGQVHFRPDVYGRDLDDAPALTAGAPVPAARPLPLGPGLDSAGLDAMLVGAARLPVQRIDP